MARHAPTWLDGTATAYYRKLRPTLGDIVNPTNEETFFVLCQTYSHYRHATDMRERTKYLDFFLKLAKEFGLTPRTSKKKPEMKQNDLDLFLGANDG